MTVCFWKKHSKSDLKSARSLMEVQYLMRLDLILRQAGMQPIQHVSFNVVTKENMDKIHDWCMQFISPNVAPPTVDIEGLQ